MLATFLVPQLKQKHKLKNTWFQQAKQSLEALHRTFENKIESHYTRFVWPALSPDLSVCNFFLWRYLKVRVYVNKPRTLMQLKWNIETKIKKIPVDTLRRIYNNFEKRLDECIKEIGGIKMILLSVNKQYKTLFHQLLDFFSGWSYNELQSS